MNRFGLLPLLFVFVASTAPAQIVPIQTDGEGRTQDTTLVYLTVVPVCTVEASSPLAIVQLSAARQDVTNVVYTCNSRDGFSRRVFSQHSGALVRGTQRINYLLSQSGNGGLGFSPVSLQTEHSDRVAAFDELTIGSSAMLRLEIPAIPPALLAGDYVDTVTIEITPN